MQSESAGDRKIDESTLDKLLGLAGVSVTDRPARDWLVDALTAARDIAAVKSRPSPSAHYAPLDRIEQAADRLITAIGALRRHPHAYGNFRRAVEFGPIHDGKFERPDVLPALENIRDAARKARVSATGRPPNARKQQIIDLALGFWVRFSTTKPSGDVNNPFLPFAKRFFKHSTGLSVERKGQGIDRQIRMALGQLPKRQRAKRLNKTRHK